MPSDRRALFWPVLTVVVALDFATKLWATTSLGRHLPQAVAGDVLRWTLVYNPGAAFGLSIGSPAVSRWVFMALTMIALGILSRLYLSTPHGATPRLLALSLVCAGAVGNLIDRVRHGGGVVDFIDVGIGLTRWPTFNVADMAVSVGAILLAWVFWDEDRQAARACLAPAIAIGGNAPTAAMVVANDATDRP